MVDRVVVVAVPPPGAAPPGVDPVAWHRALAEDTVDLVSTLAQVRAAVAAPAGEAWVEQLCWPGMRRYTTADLTVGGIMAAAHADGAQQAAVLAADVPDLPGLLVGKLLRPLTSRACAVAPDQGSDPGVVGVACRLPPPPWLPAADLDALSPAAVRAAAPKPADVAVTAGWRRLRGPAALRGPDPALAGADLTRALLGG